MVCHVTLRMRHDAMSKINRIIWYDNVDVDEELLSDTIQGVKESNEIEDRQHDRYHTSFFQSNTADSIFDKLYRDVIRRVMIDLGLDGRCIFSINSWMQVYNIDTNNPVTGQSMRVHDHFGGSELFSFVHIVQPTNTKCLFFPDSNGNKIYPETQNKGDFMVFPSWLEHGVDPVNEGERAIISGNVLFNALYSQGGQDMHRCHPINASINVIENIMNPDYVEKKYQRHSELDSL